jgi:hypothetical protein
MAFSMFLIVTLVIVLLIWLFIEIKRAKHKFFAIFIIILILFFYFSITYSLNGKTVDYKSVSGVTNASKIYLAWLGTFYGNVKTITNNIIKMDWGADKINNTEAETTNVKTSSSIKVHNIPK